MRKGLVLLSRDLLELGECNGCGTTAAGRRSINRTLKVSY